MPGSWDYRRRVRKPASLHLVGFLFASGVGPLLAGTGALSPGHLMWPGDCCSTADSITVVC